MDTAINPPAAGIYGLRCLGNLWGNNPFVVPRYISRISLTIVASDDALFVIYNDGFAGFEVPPSPLIAHDAPYH